MPAVSLDMVTNDFESHGYSPWVVEEKLVGELFKVPGVRLTTAVLGIYPNTRLPSWDFVADARRHAIRCVSNGVNERDQIADDYKQNVWPASREIILSGGRYESLAEELVRGLSNVQGVSPYAQIVRGRFGFNGKVKSSDELSEELGIPPEEVRDLEMGALRLARHSTGLTKIRSHLETARWEFISRTYDPG